MTASVEVDVNWSPKKLVLKAEGDSGLSPDQVSFFEMVRLTEANVRNFFDTETANLFIDRLLSVSKEAFSKTAPSTIDLENLKSIQVEAISTGVEVRDELLKKKLISLGWFIAYGLLAIVVWIIGIESLGWLQNLLSTLGERSLVVINLIGVIGFGVAGTGLGAAVKSLFSARIVNFATLKELASYRYPQYLYLLLLLAVYCSALFCLSFGFFDIFIGETNLASSLVDPPKGFLLGVICGFSETTIASRISTSVSGVAEGA